MNRQSGFTIIELLVATTTVVVLVVVVFVVAHFAIKFW